GPRPLREEIYRRCWLWNGAASALARRSPPAQAGVDYEHTYIAAAHRRAGGRPRKNRKTSVNVEQNEDEVYPMSHKLAFAHLGRIAITLAVAFALPGHAHGKGHGHSGGHGAHHRAHHGGIVGLWRQSSGSASAGAGNTPAGGVAQHGGHPTSPLPTTVLPSST